MCGAEETGKRVTEMLSAAARVGPATEAGRGGALPSPPGRRTHPARWRDSRLLAGVLLILAAVVLGARFVTAATASSQWLRAARPLPAGHVLVDGDLTPVKAHLPAETSRQYFTAVPARLYGRTLSRPISAGELLPADALASGRGAASRVVPVVVKAGRLPTLAPGDRVDVYVLSRPGGDRAAREVRVLTDVEFVAEEMLSTGEVSVQLRVSPATAIQAIAASQSERVDLVRVDRDAAADPGDPGPADVPAYDRG